MANITEQIISNEYQDYIIPYSDSSAFTYFMDYGPQYLDSRYMVIHSKGDLPDFPLPEGQGSFNSYLFTPKLFTTLSTVSLENSGIIQAQTQSTLQLSGKNVLMGFIDTGIDYTNPAFRFLDGRTRIVSIWDQGIESGQTENMMGYGTIYTRDAIQEALGSDTPTIPSMDTNGHGTYVAGVAAGSPNPRNEFIGVAYDTLLCVVKLKPAKQYLKEYYFTSKDAVVFQENDIMAGINFLLYQANQLHMPLVITIGLGTNQGDHNGNSPLSQMISNLSYTTYTNFAIAVGNEGGRSHHYQGRIQEENGEIEVLVPENTRGFVAELWGSSTSLASVGLQSPLGTQISAISARPGKTEEVDFLLERSKVTVSYAIVSDSGGDQMVLFRFENPTPGNWLIRVYNDTNQSLAFDMWLPITGLISTDIRFLNPDPNTTLTIPSDALNGVTASAYNAYNQSLYIHSGRGYTRSGTIKPNLAAPGVDVTGPNLRGGYTNQTGSSASASILAGSIALLQEWSMTGARPHILSSDSITAYLVRGATREQNLSYPNREWGYGKLDVFQIFRALMGS